MTKIISKNEWGGIGLLDVLFVQKQIFSELARWMGID